MTIYPKSRYDTLTPHHKDLCGRPDVFSRHTLELTFRLLRPKHPSLSLEVRNLLSAQRVSTAAVEVKSSAEHFYINLKARKIGQVVNALTKLGEHEFQQKSSRQGQLLLLKTLIQEWMKLAEWIIIQADSDSAAHR